MKVIPATNVKENICMIIQQVVKNSEPIQITSKNGNAILISEENWNSIQETLYLLSIPGMRESILEGSKESLGQCKSLEDIGWDI